MVASTEFAGSVNPARPATDRATRATASRQEALYDATLVGQFNAGSEGAFVEIMTRYREKMFFVAFSMLRNRADAEEIAQDTFVRAHRGLASFRCDSSLATWLHQIALNLSRNRYWYNFRRRQYATRSFDCAFSDENPSSLASLIPSDAPGPAQEAANQEFSELVAACAVQLAPAHREILMQRNVQNFSYDEIARNLGIGTVKSRIARARENLRVLLAKACPEFAPDSPPGDWINPGRTSGGLDILCA